MISRKPWWVRWPACQKQSLILFFVNTSQAKCKIREPTYLAPAPKMFQIGAKMRQDRAKRPPGRPKMEPRGSKLEPKYPKLEPRCPKIEPRCPQEGAEKLQVGATKAINQPNNPTTQQPETERTKGRRADRPKGSQPRGPAECAKRLNPTHTLRMHVVLNKQKN